MVYLGKILYDVNSETKMPDEVREKVWNRVRKIITRANSEKKGVRYEQK